MGGLAPSKFCLWFDTTTQSHDKFNKEHVKRENSKENMNTEEKINILNNKYEEIIQENSELKQKIELIKIWFKTLEEQIIQLRISTNNADANIIVERTKREKKNKNNLWQITHISKRTTGKHNICSRTYWKNLNKPTSILWKRPRYTSKQVHHQTRKVYCSQGNNNWIPCTNDWQQRM